MDTGFFFVFERSPLDYFTSGFFMFLKLGAAGVCTFGLLLVQLCIYLLLATRRRVHMWSNHYDIMSWKCFPHYWPFVRGTINHEHCGALMFFVLIAWISCWSRSRVADDWRHRGSCDRVVIAMTIFHYFSWRLFARLPQWRPLVGWPALYWEQTCWCDIYRF